MYNFTTSALLNTEATVQVALAILAVFVILLIRDAAKNFAHGAQLAEVRA